MAESPLGFQKETLIDPEGVSYPLDDVLSMKAVMHLEYPSSLTFSLKKKQENTNVYYKFAYFFVVVGLGVPLGLYVAQYSILLFLLEAYMFFKYLVPKYWQLYKTTYQKGVKVYYFSDPVAFVTLQQQVFNSPRGKKLLKRGFVVNVYFEQLLYAFTPPQVYNSHKLRNALRFVDQILYPVVVILVPMVFATSLFAGKAVKTVIGVVQKDLFLRYVIWNTFETLDFIDGYVTGIRPLAFMVHTVEYLLFLVESLWNWLRTEVVLILMQIEYFSERYAKVAKYLVKLSDSLIQFVEKSSMKVYLGPLINGFNKIMKSLNPELFIKTSKGGMKMLNKMNVLKSNIQNIEDDEDEDQKKDK